jgi:hypothetical protein
MPMKNGCFALVDVAKKVVQFPGRGEGSSRQISADGSDLHPRLGLLLAGLGSIDPAIISLLVSSAPRAKPGLVLLHLPSWTLQYVNCCDPKMTATQVPNFRDCILHRLFPSRKVNESQTNNRSINMAK